MRKKNLLLIGYASFIMMLCSGTISGQHGVLLPEVHEDGVTCACGQDHGNDGSHRISSFQVTPEKWPHYPSKYSTLVNQVTSRRGQISNPTVNFDKRDTIHGKNDVNLVFGAGESSVINNTTVAWPGSGGSLHSNAILVGSDYSKNAVIAIADMEGLATGALRDVRFYQQGHGNKAGTSRPDTVNKVTFTASVASCGPDDNTYNSGNPGAAQNNPPQLAQYRATLSYDKNKDALIKNFSGTLLGTVSNLVPEGSPTVDSYGGIYEVVNRINQLGGQANNGSGWSSSSNQYLIEATSAGSYYWPFKDPNENKYYVPIYNAHKPGWADYDAFVFYGMTADTLYTSTKDVTTKDDGQPLLHVLSGEYNVNLDDNSYNTALGNAQYYRPTTILLSGPNTLNTITVGDVEWYAVYLQGTIWNTVNTLFHAIDPGTCCHYSGWVSYYRDDVRFDTIRTTPSNRMVDAAVRLLDGSDVCVTGDVTDATGTPYSIGNSNPDGTDAMLVLPGAKDYKGDHSNFRLKIGGNANLLHTQDSGYYAAPNPLEYGYLYSDAAGTGPGALFPDEQTDIHLSVGTNLYNEVSGLDWSYVHPRETGTLTVSNTMPYVNTTASVYGVKGAYNGGTNIHTRTVDGNDTTGIIEIGSRTTNQDKFHIYSSGMLKNFRSGCTPVCDSLVIGGVDGLAPVFSLTNDSTPLYIINDGDGSGSYCCDGGIYFSGAGVTSLNAAFPVATGGGDLHIQSRGFVKFYDESPSFVLAKDNEVKILSDNHAIYVQKDLSFTDADTAHLTVWAKGATGGNRGYNDLACGSGAIKIDGSVNAAYAGPNGTGLVLFRSDNDDVLVGADFTFANEAATAGSGELMVQAGQDIRVDGDVTLTHDGQRSMLFEARQTAAFGGDFTATMKSAVSNGDLTIKAGYPDFYPTADVNTPLSWTTPGDCVAGSYLNREANQSATATGGDIWFGGNAAITLTPTLADSVDTYIRAYNSIYIDGDFKHSLAGGGYTSGGDLVDTTMLYAETGNLEAINRAGADVEFAISSADSSYLLLQAGNSPGDPCGFTNCYADDRWHGNILFGNDKTLTVSHDGVGPTLISASRDIENQVGANMTFTYTNTGLGSADNLTVTAGRHIETHAPYLFDYSTAGPGVGSGVMMQAGRRNCNYLLCKTTEAASNLDYNISSSDTKDNTFAVGGQGQGSILAFNTIDFKYYGDSMILMTALNGNIETDPYLHGSYPGGAKIAFDHQGKGVVRMEALDVKLHDVLEYQGAHHASDSNGWFYMAAFDSILTRDVAYRNLTDKGSVYITTDKYKASASCDVPYDCAAGGPGVHQGHIVLGYAADCDNANSKDKILFDFNSSAQNANTSGANLYIQAGYQGFNLNKVTGKANTALFADRANDRGKGYGGNITFDFMEVYMAKGSGNEGGYAEISTPNGNIWGKDSLQYHGVNGNLLIDAGLGSLEDTLHAVRWPGFPTCQGNGGENMLNTQVSFSCGDEGEWRTGNIMLKGGSVDFTDVFSSGISGTGNVTFRTREGFIDIYDKFNATNMSGHYLNYAGLNSSGNKANEWGDVSLRDFEYSPVEKSGSVFLGADDNIMLNYGYSNGKEPAYNILSAGYDVAGANLVSDDNPYYGTSYHNLSSECFARFDVNTNGYMWYRNGASDDGSGWKRKYHRMYRGCEDGIRTGVCSPLTGQCRTIDNGARPLTFDFNVLSDGVTAVKSGGLAVVATNFIDVFTAFTYRGGSGSGLHSVPGMTTLKGENVAGYGLYMKSTFNGTAPEKRRMTCEGCGGGDYEWTYIGFHDDARIHTNNQKSLLEAPVIEFFGHAELDAHTRKGTNTRLTLKADSLIFHDSAIFDGNSLELLPYTTANRGMKQGVVNDNDGKFYMEYGKAISMNDRRMPVLELGYQRCNEPEQGVNAAPNLNSLGGKESVPLVGGDIIVAFKHDFSLPIFNTVVANHARISFLSDLFDHVRGGEYIDAFIRTDLLRIRNKVEFYTDPTQPIDRRGTLEMTSSEQMPTVKAPGIYPKHIHLEPNSELSIPDENSLIVIATTTVGGYGKIHENIMVKAHGILAPGFASLMEADCQSGEKQGRLEIHNLKMEDHAIFRISMSQKQSYNPDTKAYEWTMAPDTLVVHDSIHFSGKVQLQVLSDFENLLPGCYLFLEYDDDKFESKEYVRNLILQTTRLDDYYMTLDFSEPGRVYLCVMEHPDPIVQRYVHIHSIEGVTTVPVSDLDHFVPGHEDFTFTATYANGTALEVFAKGYYSNTKIKLPGVYVSDGVYKYLIRQVVQPWDITFGDPDTEAGVGNDGIYNQRVWSHMNTLFVNVEKEDIVSIYNMTGTLYKKIEIPAGLKKVTLERGMYVVTLKDGSVHKIVIK
ncbi:MAG: T9SS type A sorting domain-containing protein [Tannerella sp.]|jgi:hypothetical protein|nr:T9SS type A sorting domain-containing protein [Tannerella sp.]